MGQNPSRDAAVAFATDVDQEKNRNLRIGAYPGNLSSSRNGASGGRANLKSELDNISAGSADSGNHDDFVHALEYGEADESGQFFDVDAGGAAANSTGATTPLTEEQREQLREELKKTEDEIGTLRQVLTARLKYANELKRKLGLTPWAEVQQDLTQGIKTVKGSQAFHKTEEALQQASEAVTKKLGQIRSSNTFKSFEEKVGTAYSSVRAKIAASTSIDQLAGHGQRQGGSAAGTQATTPNNDNVGSP